MGYCSPGLAGSVRFCNVRDKTHGRMKPRVTLAIPCLSQALGICSHGENNDLRDRWTFRVTSLNHIFMAAGVGWECTIVEGMYSSQGPKH